MSFLVYREEWKDTSPSQNWLKEDQGGEDAEKDTNPGHIPRLERLEEEIEFEHFTAVNEPINACPLDTLTWITKELFIKSNQFNVRTNSKRRRVE